MLSSPDDCLLSLAFLILTHRRMLTNEKLVELQSVSTEDVQHHSISYSKLLERIAMSNLKACRLLKPNFGCTLRPNDVCIIDSNSYILSISLNCFLWFLLHNKIPLIFLAVTLNQMEKLNGRKIRSTLLYRHVREFPFGIQSMVRTRKEPGRANEIWDKSTVRYLFLRYDAKP